MEIQERERERGKSGGGIEFGGTSLSSSRLSKRHSFNQRVYNPRPVFRIKIGILEIAAQCVPAASGRLERSRSSIRHLNVLSLPPSLSLSLPIPILFDLKVFPFTISTLCSDIALRNTPSSEQFRKLKTNFCGESVKSKLFNESNAPIIGLLLLDRTKISLPLPIWHLIR